MMISRPEVRTSLGRIASKKKNRIAAHAMQAPVFDRGETADITLWFDGSAASPSGSGGYGGVANINGHVFLITGRIGHTTRGVAEFMGLVGCMRGVIRTLQSQGWRHEYSNLTVFSDSDMVVDQMLGQYKAKDPLVRMFSNIVKSLQREFKLVNFIKIGRHENTQAHNLARQGREAFSRPSIAVYYPSLTGFVDVWIEGCRTLASHDMDAKGKDPSFMIDALFLKSIPGGNALLRNLKDPYPLSVIRSKVNMTVIGTIQLHCGVRCIGTPLHLKPLCGPDTEGCISFIVVQDLPVPVHVSWKNDAFPMNTEATENATKLVQFHPDELPEMYAHHKYWKTDIVFNGMEM
ncbi:Ribonuclease [Fragilaria crotonensis]|nr:Ribonuclease [Fragilaria crotonensis]